MKTKQNALMMKPSTEFTRANRRAGLFVFGLILYSPFSLSHHFAAEAESDSAKLKVGVRVTRWCKIHNNAGKRVSPGATPVEQDNINITSFVVDVSCDAKTTSRNTMLIITESSYMAAPIVNEIASSEKLNPAHPAKFLPSISASRESIIKWGVYPIDSNLEISVPDGKSNSSGEPIKSSDDQKVMRLIIHF